MNRDLDLVYFLVYKKSDVIEEKIVPEPMTLEVNRAYKLQNYENKIKEKPINVEILKEQKGKFFKPKVSKSCRPEMVPQNRMYDAQAKILNCEEYANKVGENINISGMLNMINGTGYNHPQQQRQFFNKPFMQPNNNNWRYNQQRSRENSMNYRSRDNSLEYGSRENSIDYRSRENSIEIDAYNNYYVHQPKTGPTNFTGQIAQHKTDLIGMLKKPAERIVDRRFTQVQSRAEPISFLKKRAPQSRQPLTKPLYDRTNQLLSGGLGQSQEFTKPSMLQKAISNIQMNPGNPSYGMQLMAPQQNQQQQIKNALPAGFGGNKNGYTQKHLKVSSQSLTGGNLGGFGMMLNGSGSGGTQSSINNYSSNNNINNNSNGLMAVGNPLNKNNILKKIGPNPNKKFNKKPPGFGAQNQNGFILNNQSQNNQQQQQQQQHFINFKSNYMQRHQNLF